MPSTIWRRMWYSVDNHWAIVYGFRFGLFRYRTSRDCCVQLPVENSCIVSLCACYYILLFIGKTKVAHKRLPQTDCSNCVSSSSGASIISHVCRFQLSSTVYPFQQIQISHPRNWRRSVPFRCCLLVVAFQTRSPIWYSESTTCFSKTTGLFVWISSFFSRCLLLCSSCTDSRSAFYFATHCVGVSLSAGLLSTNHECLFYPTRYRFRGNSNNECLSSE